MTKLDNDIDLLSILKYLFSKRKQIILTVSLFSLFGLILALTTPKEYEASIRLLSESESYGGKFRGGFKNLLGIGGISTGSSNETKVLPSSLYPEIATSLPFLLETADDSLEFSTLDLTRLTVEEYLSNYSRISLLGLVMKYTIGLPSLIITLFNKKIEENTKEVFFDSNTKVYKLTGSKRNSLNTISNRIDVRVDEELGIVTITVTMPDPLAAAQLSSKIKDRLTRIATEYKTEKLKQNLEFVQRRYEESRETFLKWQKIRAEYVDNNRNVSSQLARVELTNVQNEYNLSFDLYQTFAQELETSRLSLKKETPVFTILDPAEVPIKKSKPKTIMTVILLSFVGLFIAVIRAVFNIMYSKNQTRY